MPSSAKPARVDVAHAFAQRWLVKRAILRAAAATTLTVASILGGFAFDAAWTLTHPLETWALRRALFTR